MEDDTASPAGGKPTLGDGRVKVKSEPSQWARQSPYLLSCMCFIQKESLRGIQYLLVGGGGVDNFHSVSRQP